MTTKARLKCTRVLLVEEHPVTATGVRDILEQQRRFEVVGIADSQSEAIRLAGETAPEVVVVDLSLRDGTGLGLIRVLRQDHTDARVLVFTMHDETLYAERAMRAGAQGYLHKCASPDELVRAIDDVVAGRLSLSDEMNARLIRRAIANDTDGNGVGALSNRELEVFELIGRGTPLSLIAQQLGISVKTVESHRENIKRKLDIASATELNRFAVAWVESPA